MATHSVFSNHAGTLSESYAIGKRGIKLLQGTADPTGLSAPTGSLYIRRGEANNRVYQIDSEGTWTTLLSPDDIQGAGGLLASFANGVVTVTAPTTKHKQQFTAASLTGGSLTVDHNLGEDCPIVQVYNNLKAQVTPDAIAAPTANSITLDMTSYGAFTGTWTVTILTN